MVSLVCCDTQPMRDPALREMFEARKRVFVDLLKWNVPVLEDRFEVDQFDDLHAIYLIVTDSHGSHLASARLLPTVRPHILDSLFPELCAVTEPRGFDVLEITRFCLDRRLSAASRIEARNCLVSSIVRYALDSGIKTFVGVAELGWLQQILSFGWDCRPLGLPQRIDGRMLGALKIDISPETPALLDANQIYRSLELELVSVPAAA